MTLHHKMQVDATVDLIYVANMKMQTFRSRAGFWSWLPNVSLERTTSHSVNQCWDMRVSTTVGTKVLSIPAVVSEDVLNEMQLQECAVVSVLWDRLQWFLIGETSQLSSPTEMNPTTAGRVIRPNNQQQHRLSDGIIESDIINDCDSSWRPPLVCSHV